ncbi:hypothetical protein [Vibrio metschnikovii]|uniref:hypothetical protein n=1 Tax=Vibrio metschnikovii TaxID=28172 RepID=UPI001C2FE239|nr:hypothetical protein [Vibrio metschnikovii]
MAHKCLVLVIKAIGVFVCFAYAYLLIFTGVIAYYKYVKPQIAESSRQVVVSHQRALLDLKKEYGELVNDDISR